MKRPLSFLLGALVMLVLWQSHAAALPREKTFPEMTLRPEGASEQQNFILSSGAATSSSPIVVTLRDRPLTNADRIYRTTLQKRWLSTHVPADRVFLIRTLSECDFKTKGGFQFCDVYSFRNPSTGQNDDYYIYVGNWP